MIFIISGDIDDIDKSTHLYYKYRNLMYKTAYDILRDEHLAEDALQEAFERIIKNLHKIDEKNCSRTQSYLVIIIRNVALNMAQKKMPLNFSGDEILSDIADSDDTLDIVLRRETASELREAIEELKPIYRDVLIMHNAYGYSCKEIADLLCINVETVKKRLTRAKKMVVANVERRVENGKGN